MATTMAAAPQLQQSESWQQAVSGRFGGSTFSSAVVEQLLKEANLPPPSPTPNPSHLRSYQKVVADVKSTLYNELDVRFPTKLIFGAQGDRWHDGFRERSGLQSTHYRECYEALRQVPASGLSPEDDRSRRLDDVPKSEIQAWRERNGAAEPSDERMARGMSGGGAYSQSSRLSSIVRSMACRYLQSCPGADTMASNVGAHYLVRQAAQGHLARDQFDEAIDLLLYRIGMMRLAGQYVLELKLDFIPAAWYDDQVWDRDHPGQTEAKDRALSEIMRLGTSLFPRRPPDVYCPYAKPAQYLAAALAASGMDEVMKKTLLAEIWKGGSSSQVSRQLTSHDSSQ